MFLWPLVWCYDDSSPTVDSLPRFIEIWHYFNSCSKLKLGGGKYVTKPTIVNKLPYSFSLDLLAYVRLVYLQSVYSKEYLSSARFSFSHTITRSLWGLDQPKYIRKQMYSRKDALLSWTADFNLIIATLNRYVPSAHFVKCFFFDKKNDETKQQ